MQLLARQPSLYSASRLAVRAPSETSIAVGELLLLAAAGAAAAAISILVDFSLRIPGHAILRAALPMAAGLALVPRRGAGSVMGLSALLTVVAFRFSSASGLSPASLSGLLALGPLLDLLLWRANTAKSLLWRCAAAGLLANLIALAVRLGLSLAVADGVVRKFGASWPLGLLTYPLCGLLAGVLAALLCFRLGEKQ